MQALKALDTLNSSQHEGRKCAITQKLTENILPEVAEMHLTHSIEVLNAGVVTKKRGGFQEGYKTGKLFTVVFLTRRGTIEPQRQGKH